MSTLADRIPGKPCDAALRWLADYTDPHEAIDACPHLAWLEWLLEEIGGEAWTEYDRAARVAWAEYKRVHDPALEEYDRACSTAWEECKHSRDPELSEYRRVCSAAWKKFDFANVPALEEYKRVTFAHARRILHTLVS